VSRTALIELTFFNYYASIPTMRRKGRSMNPGISLTTNFPRQKTASLSETSSKGLPQRPDLHGLNEGGSTMRKEIGRGMIGRGMGNNLFVLFYSPAKHSPAFHKSLSRRSALRESGSQSVASGRVIVKDIGFEKNNANNYPQESYIKNAHFSFKLIQT